MDVEIVVEIKCNWIWVSNYWLFMEELHCMYFTYYDNIKQGK